MGIGENPDGRRGREFGEASSSQNERKAGLGPYRSLGSCCGCLAFRDLEEQRKKERKGPSTSQHWTAAFASRPIGRCCHVTSPPTYQLWPDLPFWPFTSPPSKPISIQFISIMSSPFVHTHTHVRLQCCCVVAFLRCSK